MKEFGMSQEDQMSRQEYVVGLLHNDTEVALVKKNRPEWQAGLLNGIGGKIEKDEVPLDAMRREFEEETGVYVPHWDYFLRLSGTNSVIHCFAAYDTGGWLDRVYTAEDEEITVYEFDVLNDPFPTVPNLRWILPMALQRGNYHTVTVSFYEGTRGGLRHERSTEKV
jgi:8-oxo-dGTP diphosphatase